MLKRFLGVFLVLSVCAKDIEKKVPQSHVRNIVVKLMNKNNKIQATKNYFDVARHERNIVWVKPIAVKGRVVKDLMKDNSEFTSPHIVASVSGGVNTFFAMKAASAKCKADFFSSIDPSLKDIAETTCEYLAALAKYNLKMEMLEITKEYVEERRKDLKEYSIRLQNSDLTKEELLEAKFKIAETESAIKNLMNDIKVFRNCLIAYTAQDNEEEIVFGELKIEQLDEFIEISGVYKSDGQIKSSHSLDRYTSEKFSSLTEFSPQISIDVVKYLKNSSELKSEEKNRADLTLSIELSPYRFFHALQASKKYEYAKMSSEWENRKYKYEYAKLHAEFIAARNKKDNAKLAMQSKKAALDSAILQYKTGVNADYDTRSPYKKMAQAREEYHNAVERYYELAERYIDKLLEYLKITGVLREIFFEEHKEFQ